MFSTTSASKPSCFNQIRKKEEDIVKAAEEIWKELEKSLAKRQSIRIRIRFLRIEHLESFLKLRKTFTQFIPIPFKTSGFIA